ncbi:MAG: DUF6799 domain-containing protein [Bacteroidia bacterium]
MFFLIAACTFSLNVMAGDGKTASDEHPNKYCAKVKEGKTVVMHNGMTMTADATLANGTQVKTDGTIIKKDGTKTMLKAGQCVDLDGKVMDEKSKDKTTKNDM